MRYKVITPCKNEGVGFPMFFFYYTYDVLFFFPMNQLPHVKSATKSPTRAKAW